MSKFSTYDLEHEHALARVYLCLIFGMWESRMFYHLLHSLSALRSNTLGRPLPYLSLPNIYRIYDDPLSRIVPRFPVRRVLLCSTYVGR